MLRVRRHRRRRVRVLLWMMLRRSQARRQELLWCIRAVVSARLWMQLRTRRRLLVDRSMHRLWPVRLRRMEPTHDTEASTKVQVVATVVVVVEVTLAQVADRWKAMRRVWVLAQRLLGALRVRQVRRLVGVHCGEVRARRMRRRRPGWQLVQLWWHQVDRWRRPLQLLRRQRRQPAPMVRRRQRSLVRQQVVRCYLVGAARRRLAVRLARVLVVLAALLRHRVWLRVQRCLMVVDRRQRQVRRLLRQLDLEVAVSTMHRQQLGKRLVQP